MQTLWQDIRYGIRMLLKKPGFTAVAILTLALGIGANTAIFSVINSIILRPLNYPQPDRIVHLWEANKDQGVNHGSVSPHNFNDWRTRSQSFEQMAAYRYFGFTLTGTGEPERITGAQASAGFLDSLGVKPLLGRDFTAAEDTPGNNRVIILSHQLWQNRFGSNPGIVGQTLSLNGQAHVVIGVMPPKFQYPDSVEMWSPLATDLATVNRGTHYLMVIGRMKPGVTPAAAQSELDSISVALEREFPDNNTGLGIQLITLHEELVGKDFRLRLWILLGAVGLVLLIACANVANLLLARASTRWRETAIRTAIGASQWRIVRQFLTESALLALCGGVIGLLLAWWGVDWLAAVAQKQFSELPPIEMDRRVYLFTLLVAMLTGILFGLAPALQSLKLNLQEALKESGPGATASVSRQRLRSTFVVAEVALSLVLLVGAGLLIRSFWQLQNVNPGFDANNLLTLTVSLPRAKYGESHQQSAFFQQLLERLNANGEIQAVGSANEIPFSGSRSRSSFSIDGRTREERDDWSADNRVVSPDYFRAMGMRLLRGRDFSARDGKDAPGVIIINETMAKRFWPTEDALGKRLSIGSPEEVRLYGKPVSREIIGIVNDLHFLDLTGSTEAEMYVPYPQLPVSSMMFAVRGKGDSLQLVGSIRSAVQSLDRDLPLASVRMMTERVANSIQTERLNTMLLTIFAALALVLAAVGLYSVMAYNVAQHTHEIGIRMALGANARDILKLVIGQGMTLTLIGVGIGALAAFGLTRLMKSLLFGVSASDPLTFLVIALVLVFVALLACYLPARRAMKTDPMVALRHE